MAVEFASFIAMGFVAGAYIDSRHGTGPWGALAGFLAGLAGGAVSVSRAVNELSKKGRNDGKKR